MNYIQTINGLAEGTGLFLLDLNSNPSPFRLSGEGFFMRDEFGRFKKGSIHGKDWYKAMSKLKGTNHPQWKGEDKKNKCKECGAEFLTRPQSTRKFCTHKCYGKFRKHFYIWNKHPKFKWNNVKNYIGLHKTLNKYWEKPELCEDCQKNEPKELANITGIYNKQRENWKFLCRICHKKQDKLSLNKVGTVRQAKYKLRNDRLDT